MAKNDQTALRFNDTKNNEWFMNTNKDGEGAKNVSCVFYLLDESVKCLDFLLNHT